MPFTQFTFLASIGILPRIGRSSNESTESEVRVLFVAQEAGHGHRVYLWEPNANATAWSSQTLSDPMVRPAPRVTCLMTRLGRHSDCNEDNVQCALSPDAQWAAVALGGELSILKLGPTRIQATLKDTPPSGGKGDGDAILSIALNRPASSSANVSQSQSVHMSWSRDARLLAITSLLEHTDPELLSGHMHLVYLNSEDGEAEALDAGQPLVSHWSRSFHELGLECAQFNALQSLERNLYVCGTFSGPCFNRRGALISVRIQSHATGAASLDVRVLQTIDFERNGYALYPIALPDRSSLDSCNTGVQNLSTLNADLVMPVHCFLQVEYDWLMRTPDTGTDADEDVDATRVEWKFFYSVRRLELQRSTDGKAVLRYHPEKAKQIRLEPLHRRVAGAPLLHPTLPMFLADSSLVAFETN